MSEVASVGKAYQLYKNRAIKTKYQLHFEEAKRWAGAGSPVARNRLRTKHQMFSPSDDVIFPGQFRQYDGAFVEGQEISTDCLGVYLVGDYRKKISIFILPQFSGKTAGLYPVLAPDQSVSLVQIQEAGPWRPTANSVYISLGLEMINRPIHYLFRKVMYLMKKRSSTLGELLFDECVV